MAKTMKKKMMMIDDDWNECKDATDDDRSNNVIDWFDAWWNSSFPFAFLLAIVILLLVVDNIESNQVFTIMNCLHHRWKNETISHSNETNEMVSMTTNNSSNTTMSTISPTSSSSLTTITINNIIEIPQEVWLYEIVQWLAKLHCCSQTIKSKAKQEDQEKNEALKWETLNNIRKNTKKKWSILENRSTTSYIYHSILHHYQHHQHHHRDHTFAFFEVHLSTYPSILSFIHLVDPLRDINEKMNGVCVCVGKWMNES